MVSNSPEASGGGGASSGRRSGRPRKQDRLDGEIRSALLTESARLLTSASDEGAFSLRAVARAVGIAAPSVYHYFPNREALITAVIDQAFQNLGFAIRSAVARASSPTERLFVGCIAYCRFGFEHPGPYRLIFGVRPLDPAGSPVPDTQGAAAFSLLVTAIADCIEAGVARSGDPYELAQDMWCAMHGMVLLRRALPRAGWPTIDVQLDRILHSITGIPLQLLDGVAGPELRSEGSMAPALNNGVWLATGSDA